MGRGTTYDDQIEIAEQLITLYREQNNTEAVDRVKRQIEDLHWLKWWTARKRVAGHDWLGQ